jgi:DNA-binding NarL/FixJ family response regulator
MTILTLPHRSPAADTAERIDVLLIAPAHRLTELERHLPDGWVVTRRAEMPAGCREPDIVLLDDPGPRSVTAACLRHPAASVVAVLSPYSDHQAVVDVLEAGADACVRSATAPVIAAHLEACRRRLAA